MHNSTRSLLDRIIDAIVTGFVHLVCGGICIGLFFAVSPVVTIPIALAMGIVSYCVLIFITDFE